MDDSSEDLEFNENIKHNDSDVDENDKYEDDDLFNDDNQEYKKASAFPYINCPSNDNYKNEHPNKRKKEDNCYFQFKFYSEKLLTYENLDYNKNELEFNSNAEKIIDQYNIQYSLKFDAKSIKWDNFSKKHHREKLYKQIEEIDWDNEYKININKKETNPYEEVFEEFFFRKSSIKLANLNYIFKFNLFSPDYLSGFTSILLIGDDGGLSDYILWHSKINNFASKIFVIPEKNSKIYKTKFRKEIESQKEANLSIIDLKKGCDIDEIELKSSQIKEFINEMYQKSEDIGISLFIAKKHVKFKKELSQEIKLKKFFLLNTIIALSVLSKGGNFVIKIYDLFTHFTVSLIYILNNYFERFSIIKPFSTRPHTASRYIIFQKLNETKPPILEYLYDYYDRYLIKISENYDVDFVYPVTKIIKDENFKNYIVDINSQITEMRIENLEELKKAIDRKPYSKYDKMDIKKKCLDLWKIPVLHFDPNQVLINIGETSNKNNKNKISSLQDIAKYYEDYNNIESIQHMLNLFDKPKMKEDVISDNKLSKEEIRQKELKDAKFEQLLKGSKKTKTNNKKKNEIESFMLKKREREEREANVKDNIIKINIESIQTNNKNKLSEIIEHNRKLEENKKIVVNENILSELAKFKKK